MRDHPCPLAVLLLLLTFPQSGVFYRHLRKGGIVVTYTAPIGGEPNHRRLLTTSYVLTIPVSYTVFVGVHRNSTVVAKGADSGCEYGFSVSFNWRPEAVADSLNLLSSPKLEVAASLHVVTQDASMDAPLSPRGSLATHNWSKVDKRSSARSEILAPRYRDPARLQNMKMNKYISLGYTALRYITLHYTTLHYTTLHYTTLHYTTLHHTTPHHTTPHYTIHHTTLHYTTPHHTTLYITPHYTALHCTALHCTLLCTPHCTPHRTALHCTALHHTALHHTARFHQGSSTYHYVVCSRHFRANTKLRCVFLLRHDHSIALRCRGLFAILVLGIFIRDTPHVSESYFRFLVRIPVAAIILFLRLMEGWRVDGTTSLLCDHLFL